MATLTVWKFDTASGAEDALGELERLQKSMTHAGIDEEFITTVRQQVTPGTSALFVVSADVVVDRVLDRFRTTGATLISTNFSAEQEERLREAFADTHEPQRG